MLFDKLSIPYFQNFMFLIFKASPVELEKALLAALEYDIVISPSFISSAQKITFQVIDNQLFAKLTQATQEHLVALQINRDTIGTLQDVFFTPPFLSFLKLRFLCQDSSQIQTVKNHEGNISNVLTFTSSTQPCDTLPQNRLPFTFQFDNLTFTLSHLEPLFIINPNPSCPILMKLNKNIFRDLPLIMNHLLPAFLYLHRTLIKAVLPRIILSFPLPYPPCPSRNLRLHIYPLLHPPHFIFFSHLFLLIGLPPSLSFFPTKPLTLALSRC